LILTGGADSYNRVSEYSESGFTRDLPELQQGRRGHGCSYFVNEAGTKVNIDSNSCGVIVFQTFLVTGGYDDDDNDLSSTELLVENSTKWIYSGELPTPRYGLRGANIDKRVIMTGGDKYDAGDKDEILEFKPSSGEWSLVDRTKSPRTDHAISIISTEEIEMYCKKRE